MSSLSIRICPLLSTSTATILVHIILHPDKSNSILAGFLASTPAPSNPLSIQYVRLAFLNYKIKSCHYLLKTLLICPRLPSVTSTHTTTLLAHCAAASWAFFLQILQRHSHFRGLTLPDFGTTSFERQLSLLYTRDR